MKKIILLFIPFVLAGCALFSPSTERTSSEGEVAPTQEVVVVVPEPIPTPTVVTPTPEPESVPAPTPSPAPKPTPIVKEFSLNAFTWDFQPNTITVKKGDRVRLSITSTDVAHGFALPDFGVRQDLEPGKTVVVEFTADKQGRFSFFCNVFCGDGHRGMKGLLIVE